ncbi:hypothetical protein CRENBAI_012528 [Crenichthys baileyi]|uniref:Uncharacterized protein n=1 Tax=Crenichthys baileyi TaxID=28760 RepID=A0AAV9RUF4_9TELE
MSRGLSSPFASALTFSGCCSRLHREAASAPGPGNLADASTPPRCQASESASAKPGSSEADVSPTSLSVTAQSHRLAAASPVTSPVLVTRATLDEPEKRLRLHARKLKLVRRTSLLHPSPELKEKVREIEENYEVAVRHFCCRPASSAWATSPERCCCTAHATPPEQC